MPPGLFLKRIYTVPRYISDFTALFNSISSRRNTADEERVTPQFRERIMIAVTQVNGCRWCAYAHSKMALSMGLSEQEISMLFEGAFDDLPQDELPALLFAQHYADTGANPDPEMVEQLSSLYSTEKAGSIIRAIRMITIGNLLGNTFDAFLSRFSPGPKPPTSIFNELGVFAVALLSLPLGLLWMVVISFMRLLKSS